MAGPSRIHKGSRHTGIFHETPLEITYSLRPFRSNKYALKCYSDRVALLRASTSVREAPRKVIRHWKFTTRSEDCRGSRYPDEQNERRRCTPAVYIFVGIFELKRFLFNPSLLPDSTRTFFDFGRFRQE